MIIIIIIIFILCNIIPVKELVCVYTFLLSVYRENLSARDVMIRAYIYYGTRRAIFSLPIKRITLIIFFFVFFSFFLARRDLKNDDDTRSRDEKIKKKCIKRIIIFLAKSRIPSDVNTIVASSCAHEPINKTRPVSASI